MLLTILLIVLITIIVSEVLRYRRDKAWDKAKQQWHETHCYRCFKEGANSEGLCPECKEHMTITISEYQLPRRWEPMPEGYIEHILGPRCAKHGRYECKECGED